MRKIAPIALVALLAVAFTSCEKEYTCNCTITHYVNGQAMGTSNTSVNFKAKKKDADAGCPDTETQSNFNGMTTTAKSECSLK